MGPLMLMERGDSTFDDIESAVLAKGGKIIRVDNVAAVTSTLDRADLENFAFSSLDLIGHGSPGRISVGMTETDVATTTDTESGDVLFHLLDSDPNVYRLLWRLKESGRLSAQVPIRLLGCHVGNDGDVATAGASAEIDGRVLMFALANLLACRIEGTTDFVTKDDFETGSYAGTAPLVFVNPTDCVPVRRSAPQPDAISPWSLVGRVPIGFGALPHFDDAPPVLLDQIPLHGGGRLPIPDELALIPELALRQLLSCYAEPGRRYPGGDGFLLEREASVILAHGDRLELLSRGRFLRWVRGASTVLFAQKSAVVRPRLERSLRLVLGRFRPSWLR